MAQMNNNVTDNGTRRRGAAAVKYVVASVIALAIAVVVMFNEELSFDKSLLHIYKVLADAFTVPGVSYLMFALLLWISGEGFFDIIAYGVGRAVQFFVPAFLTKDNLKWGEKRESYYDFKTRKAQKREEKGRGAIFCIFIVGLVFFAIAIVFLLLYFNVAE